MNRTARRIATTTGATAGALALLTGTALAHHCYVGTPSTKAPASSNWWSATVADAAVLFGVVGAECADVAAGNAALRGAGLPLSIRFFEKQTIGSSAPERVLSDGKGLEQMGAGSPLLETAVMTYAEAAGVDC